jgi:7-cyano-7-deazaguanine synthase in queuosine biosynthesis
MRLDYFKEKFDAIIPLSGGIDSAAALFKVLSENPNKKYLVFRIDMVHGTSGNRTTREAMATEKILNWLEENGHHNFGFRELRIDYSALGMTPPVWDSEVVNFAASLVIQAKPEISEFVEGAIQDDYLEKGFAERLDKIEKILRLHTGKSAEELEIYFPLKDKSKVEVMRMLPKELLNLTWSCRYPKIVSPWEFGRCHECPQCGVIDKAIKAHPNEFPLGF